MTRTTPETTLTKAVGVIAPDASTTQRIIEGENPVSFVSKITQKNAPKSYVIKWVPLNKLSDIDSRFIPILEAISSDLYRLIAGPDFSPKVRVIVETKNGVEIPVASISKTISKYLHAFELRQSPTMLHDIEPSQFALLTASTYVLAEYDLHDRNFGLNEKKQIQKIDNDYTLFNFSEMKVDSSEGNISPLYGPFCTDFVTTWDIAHFPDLLDFKAANTLGTMAQHGLEIFYELLGKLINSADYKKQVFYIFTNALLLIENEIDKIICDHSVSNYSTLEEKLKNFLLKRIEKLKMALLYLPEYRHFLTTHYQDYFNHYLVAHIQSYNAAVSSEKKHKSHRAISIDACKVRLDALVVNCNEQQDLFNRFPVIEIKFRFRELLKRSKREILAAKSLRQSLTYLIEYHNTMLHELICLNNELKENETKLASAQQTLSDLSARIDKLTKGNNDRDEAIFAYKQHYRSMLIHEKVTSGDLRVLFPTQNSLKDFFQNQDVLSESRFDEPLLDFIGMLLSYILDHQPTQHLQYDVLAILSDSNNPLLMQKLNSFFRANPESFLSKLRATILFFKQTESVSHSFSFFEAYLPFQSIFSKCALLLSGKSVDFSSKEVADIKELLTTQNSSIKTEIQLGHDKLINHLRFLFSTPDSLVLIDNQHLLTIQINLTMEKSARVRIRQSVKQCDATADLVPTPPLRRPTEGFARKLTR